MSKSSEQTEDKSPGPGQKRRVMVGAIGKCVHNLGVEGFADWMEDQPFGYVSVKLGPAVPIREVVNKVREARATWEMNRRNRIATRSRDKL